MTKAAHRCKDYFELGAPGGIKVPEARAEVAGLAAGAKAEASGTF